MTKEHDATQLVLLDAWDDHGKSADGIKAGSTNPASAGHADTPVVATAGRQAPTLSMSLQQMRASDIPTTPQAGLAYTTVSGPTSHDPGGFS